jgi:hypothetical protein
MAFGNNELHEEGMDHNTLCDHNNIFVQEVAKACALTGAMAPFLHNEG